MEIMITGATGMLGQALARSFQAEHHVHALSSRDLDITQRSAVEATVKRIQPDVILHAAAYTRVDDAERDQESAYKVNALGTANIAAAGFRIGARVVYYSSDYVFNGSQRRPYREWDPPAPINEYGRSKLAGENLLRDLHPRHLIIRTSWLFGPGGKNFVNRIIQLAGERDELKIVDDQRGCPTYTPDLAAATLELVKRGSLGTYHVTNSNDCSWFEFAGEIVTKAGLNVHLDPTDSKTFAAPAPRPAFSVLDNYMLRLEGLLQLRSWQEALSDYLSAS
ncbi:MAG TPA: dTDP-4-dehydrorhamnose reductase [Acidobacteriota bacterium]|nr:dTDP-4-dehydrorhamnose reductase [Acidobacteriota bacterium]